MTKVVREFSCSREEVFEYLRYDSETGEFFWGAKGPRVGNGHATVRAGKRAGGLAPGGHGKLYWGITLFGERVRAHRIAWFMHYGVWPTKLIDHEDGDGLNNRIANLRECDYSENAFNIRKASSRSTSGYPGVHHSRRIANPWRATIKVNGKTHSLGNYPTKEEAIAARKKKEAELLGSFRPQI